MKLWFNFIVLVAAASFCQAVPLKDNLGNDNEVSEEMMKGRMFIYLEMHILTSIDRYENLPSQVFFI